MDPEAAQLEKQRVHDVYESTAPYFSDLQSKAWPRVRQFLQGQKPGSLIADIDDPHAGFLLQSYGRMCNERSHSSISNLRTPNDPRKGQHFQLAHYAILSYFVRL